MTNHITGKNQKMATYKNGQHKYSAEEDEWLRQNIDTGTWSELTKWFNEKFDTKIKCISSHALKRLHLKKSFNRGDAKKGERLNTNTLPIGTERFNGQCVYVKIANNVNDCQNRKMPSKHKDTNWVRKDYLVWQQRGNRLPKDSSEMLIHLNKDKRDCSIENLYLTTRSINLNLAKNGWHSTERDVTLTAIKYCELMEALKGEK